MKVFFSAWIIYFSFGYFVPYFSASIGQVFKGESKGRSSQNYQHETAEPCYLSSSIYYGGQENYSPRTRTSESQHMVRVASEACKYAALILYTVLIDSLLKARL